MARKSGINLDTRFDDINRCAVLGMSIRIAKGREVLTSHGTMRKSSRKVRTVCRMCRKCI